MPKVRDADRNLRALGYVLIRQTGSHMVYQHPKTGANVVIPSSRGLQGGDIRHSTYQRLFKKAEAKAKQNPTVDKP